MTAEVLRASCFRSVERQRFIAKISRGPSSNLLLVLGRHSRRKQRCKRYSFATGRGSGRPASRRRITARQIHDNGRRDELPYGFDKTASAIAEIHGEPALRVTSRDFTGSLVGFFRERIAVWNSICPRNATRPVGFVEGLDPQIDRS